LQLDSFTVSLIDQLLISTVTLTIFCH